MNFDLELCNIKTKIELHIYVCQKLQFPKYYGKNLNALYDCLTERADIKRITFYNFTELQLCLGGYADSFLKVFQDAGIDVIINS